MNDEGRTIRVFKEEHWEIIRLELLKNGLVLVPVDDMVPGTGLNGFHVIAMDASFT